MSAFALSFSQSSGTIRFPWYSGYIIPCYGQYTTIRILYANVCSFHILPLFIMRRPFQSAYPSVFSPKTRKTPAAARRGLSLWVSMKFYIICVYCFSAFPCYEIFYTHINLRLPELLIQIHVGRSSINIWYTGIYVMKSCRHILYEIKAIGTMSSIHRPSLLLKLS